MSGHSKWATIKRKKGATDAKRSNEFAKLLRFVEVAAREGGSGDPKANMTLATAVDKARAASVPNDNIDRAIKRGTGELEGGARYEEVTYEGYGAGRRRAVHRGADRQPQPHRPGGPPRVHAEQRQPRRERERPRGCSRARA